MWWWWFSVGSFRQAAGQISSVGIKRLKSKKSGSSNNYSTPHPRRDPPPGYKPSMVHHVAFEVPDFIPAVNFRPFMDPNEPLGPNASKNSVYKNPEYFAYHRYSFAELMVTIAKEVQKRIDERGVQTMYPEEEDSDSEICGEKSNSDDSGSNSESEGFSL